MNIRCNVSSLAALILTLAFLLQPCAGHEEPAQSALIVQPKGKDPKGMGKDYGSLKHFEIKVGGVMREALVHYPKFVNKSRHPIVFVFHGHGQGMRNASDHFKLHQHWPHAICVYMKGLPTPQPNDPEGKKQGWQHKAGDFGDRDLLFFDHTLKHMHAKHPVEEHHIFVTGFSNGAYFTYLLWANRGHHIRAIAPVAGLGATEANLKPKPCLHIAGRNDNKVPFAKQEETMHRVMKINACDPKENHPWHKDGPLPGVLHPSAVHAPFVAIIHNGDHEIPGPAGKMIAEFFKQVSK